MIMTISSDKQIVFQFFSKKHKVHRASNYELDKKELISALTNLPSISIPTKIELLNVIELAINNKIADLSPLDKFEIESVLTRLKQTRNS